ncbi:hypothetical protein [Arthrobacter sp. 92]|uniref:hypothetical protein n=1 Tax=Arthrobacter sp. 92 TaxID=3418175 RepID=UPI003D0794B3
MVNAILGDNYYLSQRLNNIEAQLRGLSTQQILLNASTGQDGGQGLSIDAGGMHLFNPAGVEVTTLSTATGELKTAGTNGAVTIAANATPVTGTQPVPNILLQWTAAGTTQTKPAAIYSYENRVGILSPAQSTVPTAGYLSVNNDSWSLACTDKSTGLQSGAAVTGTNTGTWGIAGSGAAAPYAQGNSDSSWTVAQSGNGPSVYSTPGVNGAANLAGGGTNGSVNLVSHGTGSVALYGNTTVSGTFSATGTKAFVMPHPLDPAKTLMHASTESPVNGVEYWGTATTDATGTATVTLPTYFEALTKPTGRAILLTPEGPTPAQLSYEPIAAGAFTVHGPAWQSFSWLVKAVRQQIVNGTDVLAFQPEQTQALAPASRPAPAEPAAVA